jgi:hypothetical protein
MARSHATRGHLVRNLRGQTERVPCGIQEDQIGVRIRLYRATSGPESEGLLCGGTEILHREVEVDLLGRFVIGPCRRNEVLHGDRRQPNVAKIHCDERVAPIRDLAMEERRPEISEWVRVCAIERDGTESDVGW